MSRGQQRRDELRMLYRTSRGKDQAVAALKQCEMTIGYSRFRELARRHNANCGTSNFSSVLLQVLKENRKVSKCKSPYQATQYVLVVLLYTQ